MNASEKDTKTLHRICRNDETNEFAESNVAISRVEWNSFKSSWDFQRHPLIPEEEVVSDD